MAQFYASNADSVSDFMKNYSDQQIEGMEDMTDSVANRADLAWKDGAERTRAMAEGKAEEGGEILGSVLGVKGLGKGIGKLRKLYKRGQDLKDAIKKKQAEAEGEGDEGTEAPEGTEATEDTGEATEDTGEATEDTGEGTGEGTGGGEDIGEGDISAEDLSNPLQDDSPETSENLGDNLATADEGAEASVDTATEAVESTFPEDVRGVNLASLQGDDATFAGRLLNYRPALSRYAQWRQETREFRARTAPKDTDEAGDTRDENSNDLFEGEEGGEEGTFQGAFSNTAASAEEVSASSGLAPSPKVGDGDVEDVLQRPSTTQLQDDQADNAGQAAEDDVENAFVGDEPTSIGGATELDTYSSTAPYSYTRVQDPVSTTASNPQVSSAEGIDQGGTRSLASERQYPERTFDVESGRADTARPNPRITIEEEDGAPQPLSETTEATTEATEATTEATTTGTGDAGIQMGEVGEVENDTAFTDTGEYGKNITSAVKTQTADTTETTAGDGIKAGEKAGEDAAEDGVDAGVEAGVETGGELGAEIGFDTAVSAIPVLGEAALIGTGLYEGIKGLISLFEDKPKPPPKPKEVGGVLGGGNPLGFGGSQFTSKLASSIPTAENSLDSSGMMSF